MASPWNRTSLRQLLLLAGLVGLASIQYAWLKPEPSFKKWEPQIRAFEKRDATNTPPKGAVLVVGSSSIGLWNSLKSDLGPFPVFRRGFGGSQIADITAFADRIILPYEPRMALLYAGDNDLACRKPARQVLKDFRKLVERIHCELPETRIGFISIKPSPARWRLAGRVKRANALVKAYIDQNHLLDYIDVFTPMVNESGLPRPELFADDGLHLNAQGYKLWTSIIRRHLADTQFASVHPYRPPVRKK